MSSLACGKLDAKRPEVDLIFVGSKTNLLVYDCVKNADLFDKEIDDGLQTMFACEPGVCPEVEDPLVIVGGN